MTAKSYLTKVQCLECHQEFEFFPGLDRCPECNGVWLDAQYNYQAVAGIWKNGLSNRINSLWRFAELLPILDPAQIVSMGEGLMEKTPFQFIMLMILHLKTIVLLHQV